MTFYLNSLDILNFGYKQNVSFTYHNTNSRSYIDHVLASPSVASNTKSCKILSDVYDNTSDHFPILTNICLDVKLPSSHKESLENRRNMCINWGDNLMVRTYKELLTDACEKLPPIDQHSVRSAYL